MTDLDAGPSPIRDDSICESSLHPNKSSGDIGELKPCRKCGVLDFELWDGRGTQAYLVCNECGQEEGVQVVDLFDQDERPSWDDKLLCYPPHAVKRTNEHLIEEWNTRTPDPESAAEIERLRRELDAANSNHRSMAHQLAETGIRLEAIKRERDELYQANIEWARGNLVNAREKIAMECHALTAESAVAAAWEEAAKIAEQVGNFGDYKREELTPDFGQPRFDMMTAIASAIRAAGAEKTAESGHSPSTHNSESE